ncbi:MAG: sigma 54-interacting transcriptional regulator [Acidobacteria bacterium]|nr:sigma 54-interacting transcriptional regulator [Acidobacteriota bacterium]
MKPRLIIVAGAFRGTVFALTGDEVVVGRDAGNGVCLADPSVSRRHCLIRREQTGCIVRDLDSFNGTFVNGLPVKEQPLARGDQLGVGDVLLLFLDQDEEAEEELRHVKLDDSGLVTRSAVRLRREDALYLHSENLLAHSSHLSRAARDLNALLKISMAINSIRDMGTLQRQLLELILEAVPAERAAILLAAESALDFVSAFGWSRTSGGAAIHVSKTVAGQVLQGGEAILSNDVGLCEASVASDSLVASQVKSLLCVPLSVFERVIGVIYCDTSSPASPFDENHLQLLTAIAGVASVAVENVRRVEMLAGENRRLQEELGLESSMIGESAPMRNVYQRISRLAPADSTVLIRGESGTGKELAARAIHLNSGRRENAFVAVNCATLTEHLLESELFGHEKGAFTGAIAQKKGKIEVAERGTLFLDEVGELPPPVQAKLLRVLQEREFERLGSTRPIKSDVRVIAATNRDLEEDIRRGAFRKDLYFRLNVISLKMPALSDRREDIPLLANYFLAKYSRKCKRKMTGISPEAHACLEEYWWPGNVRELENAIEYAVVLGTTDFIVAEDLPETIVAGRQSKQNSVLKFYQAVIEFKRGLVLNALGEAGGNVTEAARLLGISPPNNLHRIINNLGLRDSL